MWLCHLGRAELEGDKGLPAVGERVVSGGIDHVGCCVETACVSVRWKGDKGGSRRSGRRLLQ